MSPSASTRPAYAGVVAGIGAPMRQTFPLPPQLAAAGPRAAPGRRPLRRARLWKVFGLTLRPGAGLFMALALLSGAGYFGAVRGGQYQAFVTAYGSPADLVARVFGLRLDAITISGQRELTTREILDAAGFSDRNSLLLLNAHEVRDRLKAVPLVRDADVRKLYPNRLMIDIVEREPYALWQKDGQVVVVSADGTVIDAMRDQRFASLPFVVGASANEHVGEFLKILEAVGDLRSRVRAGVYVSQRRWNLKLDTGVDVKLPENDPAAAAATLARLQREARILDKDLLSIDLRLPGKMVARLTEDAGAAWAEAHGRKAKGKGGAT
jgi:cell division protein FtsQ